MHKLPRQCQDLRLLGRDRQQPRFVLRILKGVDPALRFGRLNTAAKTLPQIGSFP
jgi:hypothetical protein